MAKASQEILEQLHGLQAQAMIEELQRARTSGEGIQASLFAAISRVLKDNNIDGLASDDTPLKAVLVSQNRQDWPAKLCHRSVYRMSPALQLQSFLRRYSLNR